MRQFIDADCSNRKRKNKKNLQRKNQIEPLEIIMKYKNYEDEKKRKFSTNFDLMTTFPNASNPKKTDQNYCRRCKKILNRKRKYEQRKHRARAKSQ